MKAFCQKGSANLWSFPACCVIFPVHCWAKHFLWLLNKLKLKKKIKFWLEKRKKITAYIHQPTAWRGHIKVTQTFWQNDLCEKTLCALCPKSTSQISGNNNHILFVTSTHTVLKKGTITWLARELCKWAVPTCQLLAKYHSSELTLKNHLCAPLRSSISQMLEKDCLKYIFSDFALTQDSFLSIQSPEESQYGH